MLVYPGKLSLYCFLSSLISVFFLIIPYAGKEFMEKDLLIETLCFTATYFLLYFILLRLILKGFLYQVGIRAAFVGTVFSSGIFVVVLAPTSYKIFGCYLCVLSFFHYSEFLAIALSNPETLSVDSFILDHSLDYKIAAAASWIEFFIERYIYPGMKTIWWFSLLGLTLCLLGETLRKAAMLTARVSFTHTVQNERKPNHKLITSGVYSWARHPSYVGWFYWAIGTQIILVNPVCILVYTLASWKFFHDRIIIEEVTLLSFFGEEYMEYQRKVPSGLPLISGYLLDNHQDKN